MKKLLLLALVGLTISASAQRSEVNVYPDPVNLHLSKHKNQYNTGKGFMWAGAGIIAGSMLFALNKNSEAVHYQAATAMIGSAFSLYGFISVADARRHEKKAWAVDRTAIK